MLTRLSGVTSVALGERGVWVGGFGTRCPAFVSKIDPGSNVLAGYVRVPDVQDVAAGAGAVWVVGSGGCRAPRREALHRIDPSARKVVATIPLDLRSKGRPPTGADGVVVSDGDVWVALNHGGESGEILRIDPRSRRVVARIPARGRVGDIAPGTGAIWFLSDRTSDASGGVSLHRLDPAENEIVATPLSGELHDVGGTLVLPRFIVGRRAVWIGSSRGNEHFALRVDARTSEVKRRRVRHRFYPVAAAAGKIWSLGSRGLVALDPRTLSTTASVKLDLLPGDVAVDPAGDAIWLTSLVNRASERGSVVRVDLR